jgi:Rrf2 family iron-sulfur cluster assembly transcriptional regulator
MALNYCRSAPQKSIIKDKEVRLYGELMIISKATGYGIRALAYLASQPRNRLCGLQEIASHEHIPPVFLRKVLGELRRHRLLRSVKGIHGGYELAREPNTITLWEVAQKLDPDPGCESCVLGTGLCSDEHVCVLHYEWQKIREAWLTLLKTQTIFEIKGQDQAHT